MTQTGQNEAGSKQPTQPDKENTVITPAGPVPKDKVHRVGPDEMVRRKADGSLEVVPKDSGQPVRK